MDRDRDRRREIPPEDQYGTGRGQSYRPGNVRERTPPPSRLGGDSYRARSPPRRSDYMDSYKADMYRVPRGRSRSPPRREDERAPLRREDDRGLLRRDDDRSLLRRDDERLPPRRDDFRRRSPSPPRYRDERQGIPRGGDSYRGRPRSPPPPRREDLPRDDLFRREPARDDRDYRDTRDYRDERDRPYVPPARSPIPRYRERSPVPLKRGREPSPISSRGRRTPPPAKRERLASPPRGRYADYPPSRGVSPSRRRYSPERARAYSPSRGGVTRGYRLHSRSPLARNERVDPRAVDDWRRPRSPIREPRPDYLSREESAANSGATSRLSTPPVHPGRISHLPPDDRAPFRASLRDPYDDRDSYHVADPEPRGRVTPPSRDPYEEDHAYANTRDRDPVPPPREPRRNDDLPVPTPRAPPTGPSSQRVLASNMAPPAGPAAATVTPSGPRVAAAPPSGPRGGPTPRGDFAARGRGGFGGDFAARGRGGFGGSFRGGRGGAPPVGPSSFTAARSISETFNPPSGPSAQPPSGPRNSFSQASPPSGPASFSRQGSITSAGFPRPQPFPNGTSAIPDAPTGPKLNRRPTEHSLHGLGAQTAPRAHPALADLPKIVEGGQKMESVVDRVKLNKLEDEAERLRKQIEDKEMKKRKALRDWDRMSRETEAAALRSELAEEALRTLNGDAEGQAAF